MRKQMSEWLTIEQVYRWSNVSMDRESLKLNSQDFFSLIFFPKNSRRTVYGEKIAVCLILPYLQIVLVWT